MPIGFAHTDDMKVDLYNFLMLGTEAFFIDLLSVGVVLNVVESGSVQCVLCGFLLSLTVHNNNSGNGSVSVWMSMKLLSSFLLCGR